MKVWVDSRLCAESLGPHPGRRHGPTAASTSGADREVPSSGDLDGTSAALLCAALGIENGRRGKEDERERGLQACGVADFSKSALPTGTDNAGLFILRDDR